VLDDTTFRCYGYTATYKSASETIDVPSTGENLAVNVFALLSLILAGVILVIRRKVDKVR